MVIYYPLKNGSRNPCIYLINYVLLRDKNGKWQSKTEKEYLCIKNGIERGFTAVEFKTVQNDGWEKQYPSCKKNYGGSFIPSIYETAKSETAKAIGEADRYSVHKRLENYINKKSAQKSENIRRKQEKENER